MACFWNIVSWLHSQSSSHPVSSYFNLTLLKLQTGITLHGSALSAMPSDIWGYIISVGGWPEPFSAVAVWGGGHPNSLPRGTPRPNSALQLDCRAVMGYPGSWMDYRRIGPLDSPFIVVQKYTLLGVPDETVGLPANRYVILWGIERSTLLDWQ